MIYTRPKALSNAFAVGVLLILASSSVGSSFAAETKTSKATAKAKKSKTKRDAKAAKQAYIKAQTLFKAEEFEMALPLFLEAYELSNRKPTAIMGLAQCERMLKMYDEAVLHYEEFLATNPKPVIVSRVQETLSILRAQREQAQAKALEEASKRAEAKKKEEERRRREAAALTRKLTEKLAEKPSTWSNPWLWLGIGVLVAGASVGVGYVATDTGVYGGTTDTIFGGE